MLDYRNTMDKKTIMKMNDTWKDFRVNERLSYLSQEASTRI